ncbi:unnamed protein product [Bemisia tabaci]|uniref:PDZ domain-containing protein n=1 Tax=Bemisia tabaci TaxID=7038 RepID=A0A9P0AKH7_BEMTA|nr:unnamed protein product [Bemisia tabaci]
MDEILPGNREITNVSNGPSLRRTPSTRETIHHTTTIIVNKDERGYGMKVSGDNPVYVQSVKEGGAAERAGLHSGDKIIKVNGVNVTHSTHTEVVDLIKGESQVPIPFTHSFTISLSRLAV